MRRNQNILDTVLKYNAQVVVVTKYLRVEEMRPIVELFSETDGVLGFGENRIDSIKEKNLPREKVHFIGNIQSRVIRDIIEHCSVIHSLDSLKHAAVFEKYMDAYPTTKFFLQINISEEPQKRGVLPNQFPEFLVELKAMCPKLHKNIIGISALGGDVLEDEKRQEFQRLKKIRDEYFVSGTVSAGTSRDYEFALEEGVEVVRIGKAFWE